MSIAPLISCVIPVYNGKRDLPRAVKSALDQGPRVQVVLVDDGSTDGTRELVLEMARDDSRIVALPQSHNRGQGHARNIGVAAADAPFITFLDHDDEHIVGWYRHAVDMLERDQRLAAVRGEMVLMNVPAEIAITRSDPRWTVLLRSPVWNLVMRKLVYQSIGGCPGSALLRGCESVPFGVALRENFAVAGSQRLAIQHYLRPEGSTARFLRGTRVVGSGFEYVELTSAERDGTLPKAIAEVQAQAAAGVNTLRAMLAAGQPPATAASIPAPPAVWLVEGAAADYVHIEGAELDSVAALNNRGLALIESDAPQEALECFERALQLGLHGLDLATLHRNRALVLHSLNRPLEALASYDRALGIYPDLPPALNGRGMLLQDLGRFEEAKASYERALALQPDFSMARFNLGMTCLAMGLWREGWEHYEARWDGAHEVRKGRFGRPRTALPQWGGETATGNDGLLVFVEQGLGDALQMARYLPLAARRFAKLSVVVDHAPLVRLFRASFSPAIEILDTNPADQSAWQWQCPTLSLPRAFGTTAENVPAEVPYLRLQAEWVGKWRDRLDKLPAKHLKVGLAWAGERKNKNDAKRSIELRRFAPLLEQSEITWVSLQKGEDARQPAGMPEGAAIYDWMDEAGDLADTAGLISLLDLVISVDTSVVHLAGAFGKPVWMLNRFESEWRWLRGREDSPWYPSLRIFTQKKAGDWDEVLQRVGEELAGVLADKSR